MGFYQLYRSRADLERNSEHENQERLVLVFGLFLLIIVITLFYTIYYISRYDLLKLF